MWLWWLGGCVPDGTDPEVAWRLIQSVQPWVPSAVSQCVAGVSFPSPDLWGIDSYGVRFDDAGCNPISVEVYPTNGHQGWFMGTSYRYERRFDGVAPADGHGRWVEVTLPDGWYLLGIDDF